MPSEASVKGRIKKAQREQSLSQLLQRSSFGLLFIRAFRTGLFPGFVTVTHVFVYN
jgi:hypothetical protein